jgi:hypothetical protein
LLFFAIGVIIGTHREVFEPWLKQRRGVMLATLLAFVPLSIVEGHVVFLNTGLPRVGFSLASALYALSFIFWWLSLEGRPGRIAQSLQPLTTKVYGIFLIHALVLEVVNKGIDAYAPWVFGIQLLYQPVLIAAGLLVPLTMMAIVRRSRLRQTYSYLFG